MSCLKNGVVALLLCLLISRHVLSNEALKSLNAVPVGDCKSVSSKKLWSILVYMEADNNLSECAVENINDMKNSPTSENVNLLIQWNEPRSRKTNRLKIEQSKIFDVGSLNQEMGLYPAKEFYDSISWMKDKYPADRYMIVLWNHGNGYFDRSKKSWLNPLCFAEEEDESLVVDERDEKGILYNDTFNTCLSTDQMTKVLEDGMIRLDQPIDIVGMDACLMAMVEIAYALRHSTKILVGSENVELGQGWNYSKLISGLMLADGKMSPDELAKLVVTAYQTQYLKIDPTFTQSAIRTECVSHIKDNLNHVAIDLLHLKILSRDMVQKMFDVSYKNCIKFGKDYSDLYTFCEEMAQQVNQNIITYQKYLDRQVCKEIIAILYSLLKHLTATKKSIKDSIIANGSGLEVFRAAGLSIYLPNVFTSRINTAYFQSDFAKYSAWGQLLTSLAMDKSIDIEGMDLSIDMDREA